MTWPRDVLDSANFFLTETSMNEKIDYMKESMVVYPVAMETGLEGVNYSGFCYLSIISKKYLLDKAVYVHIFLYPS